MTRLERIATAKAKEIFRSLGGEPPMEPEDVCDLLKIQYRRRILDPRTDGVYFRTSTGVPYACVNIHGLKPPGRIRFTAMHECGHHILQPEMRISHTHFLDCRDSKRTPLEKACNAFAAELLMPADLIREWWQGLAGNREYRERIIADRCGVTNTALAVRLEELGLRRRFRAGDFYR